MNVIPDDLTRAATDARNRLCSYARETATARASGTFASMQAGMAKTARETIFTDALLQAMRARLQEFKTVSKT
jgi:hypothetical protein